MPLRSSRRVLHHPETQLETVTDSQEAKSDQAEDSASGFHTIDKANEQLLLRQEVRKLYDIDGTTPIAEPEFKRVQTKVDLRNSTIHQRS